MNVRRAGRQHQGEKSRRTREHVLRSTARLICEEGLPSASPRRITEQAGMSWGAVQHHFGSKEELLGTIVRQSREEMVATLMAEDYAALDLAERIALYVKTTWRHYQTDGVLAGMEISLWQRSNGFAVNRDVIDDDGRATALTRDMRAQIFAGTGAEEAKLAEASEYMHCVFYGLVLQRLLIGGSPHEESHLDHCRETMANIIAG